MQNALLRSGIAEEGEHGLIVSSSDQAEVLMCALAGHAVADLRETLPEDTPRTLDAPNTDAARPNGAQSRPAIVVALPVITGVGSSVTADQLVNFGQKEATGSARQDYLGEVDKYLEGLIVQHPSMDASLEASAKLRRDLELASSSWVPRARSAGLNEVVLSSAARSRRSLRPRPSVSGWDSGPG